MELSEIPMLEELASTLGTNLELAFYVAVSVVALSFIVSLFLVRAAFAGGKGDTILLVGLCGAGKTSLFSQLRDGSVHNGTVTSMEPNDDRFPLHSEWSRNLKTRPVHVVDLPGHPRLRAKIDAYLPHTRGIVFVVDALDFQLRPTAELLYDTLTKKLVASSKVPVLVACNKMDNVSAHSVEFIGRQLEKEIEKLRVTRNSLSDADMASDVKLGREGEPFKFTHVGNKVTFAGVVVLDNGISDVERFIRDRVKP